MMDLQSEVHGQAGRWDASTPLGDTSRIGRFDPDELVHVTSKNSIAFVTRVSDHTTLEVATWLPTLNKGALHSLRPEIRSAGVRKEYPFVCSACGEAVVLKAYTDYGHFFSHLEKQRAEDVGCPFRESREMTREDLDRIRYHGQREGSRHLLIKELIARTLRADARFSPPEIEATWRSFIEGWRRPDVSSRWGETAVVFEAQVSNTYPQIVAERTEFYRRDGALLVWIFDRQPDETWRTLHADAFCVNQQHLFVVDAESVAESERQHRAFLRTYSLRPSVRALKADTGKFMLEEIQIESFALVPFDELKLDVQKQTSCRFDVAEEKRRSRHKVLCTEVHAGMNADTLRGDIQDILKSDHDIPYAKLASWAALVCAIESARFGCGVGTKYPNPVSVLNQIFDHHASVVGLLDKELCRQHLDRENFHDGAWGKRVRMIRKGRYNDGDLPEQHAGSRTMLDWLYGEKGSLNKEPVTSDV